MSWAARAAETGLAVGRFVTACADPTLCKAILGRLPSRLDAPFRLQSEIAAD